MIAMHQQIVDSIVTKMWAFSVYNHGRESTKLMCQCVNRFSDSTKYADTLEIIDLNVWYAKHLCKYTSSSL